MMKVDSDRPSRAQGIQCGIARISIVASTGSPSRPSSSKVLSARTDGSCRMFWLTWSTTPARSHASTRSAASAVRQGHRLLRQDARAPDGDAPAPGGSPPAARSAARRRPRPRPPGRRASPPAIVDLGHAPQRGHLPRRRDRPRGDPDHAIRGLGVGHQVAVADDEARRPPRRCRCRGVAVAPVDDPGANPLPSRSVSIRSRIARAGEEAPRSVIQRGAGDVQGLVRGSSIWRERPRRRGRRGQAAATARQPERGTVIGVVRTRLEFAKRYPRTPSGNIARPVAPTGEPGSATGPPRQRSRQPIRIVTRPSSTSACDPMVAVLLTAGHFAVNLKISKNPSGRALTMWAAPRGYGFPPRNLDHLVADPEPLSDE